MPLLLLEASWQFEHNIFRTFSTWDQKDSGTMAMATRMLEPLSGLTFEGYLSRE